MSEAQEPISLEQAKLHLRLDLDDQTEDDSLNDLISAARDFVEAETGLVLTPRQITETAQQLGRWIDLRSWPVGAVTAVRAPVAGVMTALTAGSWAFSLTQRPVRIIPAQPGWGVGAFVPCVPVTLAASLPIEIDIEAGYASPDEVPARVKRAMLLLIGHWYSNRDAAEVGQRAAAIELPMGVSDLLRRLKNRRI